MPTAASIQILNDANGTAHAFLEDDGFLWQCQWNSEAQRWDKGAVVPGAYGGEKLQALYLENLWPTSDSSGNNLGTAPGVVLAYKVGEGSSSQVLATFGRWGSDGQLQWSAPETLSAPGVEVQAFTLVPGEASTQTDSAGLKGQGQSTFSLVVQAQQGEQISLPGASQPDSDLYTNTFRLVVSNSGKGVTLQTLDGIISPTKPGVTTTTYNWAQGPSLDLAVTTATPASTSILVAGNTQISRQLLTPTANQPSTIPIPLETPGGSTWLRGSTTAGSDSSKNQVAFSEKYFGQTISRWQVELAQSLAASSASSRKQSKDAETDLLLTSSLDESLNSLNLVWSGTYGFQDNQGLPYSYSTATLSLYVQLDNSSSTIYRNWLGEKLINVSDEFKKTKVGFGIAGSLATTYGYDQLSGLSYIFPGGTKVISVDTQETVAWQGFFDYTEREVSGNLWKFSVSGQVGIDFSQYAANENGLGTYYDVAADLARLLNVNSLIGGLSSNLSYNYKGLNTERQTSKDYGSEFYGYLYSGKKGAGSVISAIGGTLVATSGPLGLLFGFGDLDVSTAVGLQEQFALSGGWIYKGLIGPEVSFSQEFEQFIKNQTDSGSNSGSFEVDIALPLGVTIPLVDLAWPKADSQTQPDLKSITTESEANYPFNYNPASASNSYFAPNPSKGSSANPYAFDNIQDLKLFTLEIYSGVVGEKSSDQRPITLYNAGSGLKDSPIESSSGLPIPYTNVPIMAVGLDGSTQAFAQASFTVQSGSIVASTLQITQGGQALLLPEASATSGIYALLLDVFSSGIASPPSSAAGNPFSNLPLITVDSSQTGSPLQVQTIARVWSVPVDPLAQQQSQQQAGVSYPEPDGNSPASNDNGAYSYTNVQVELYYSNDLGVNKINILNGPTTATVLLSNGVIQAVELNEALLFAPPPSGSSTSIQLDLPAFVQEPGNKPTFAVTPQALAFNNLVADEQFSAQAGAADSGVYLSAGVNDALPLLPQMGAWPVQNRVVYATRGANGEISTSILNGQESTSNGISQIPSLNPPSLEELYNNPSLIFSAASRPTAATIAGPESAVYSNATFVAWVEATDPVVPITSSDGTTNYQSYMQALYGKQRINYRLQVGGEWESPAFADLYAPDGAVITELQAFNVANPAAPWGSSTLLVWSELSIAAIQGTVADLGAGTAIPAVLKAGFLNPSAKTKQWNDLFSDANGESTIQTIPWDPSTDVGLTIEDISIASQPLLLADGTIAQAPLVSWSQRVRTPYRQSVLNDEPAIFLELGALQAGLNTINIGTIQEPSTTTTLASSTGLNFAMPGALPKSQAAAVQNIDGTGVLSTGLGSLNGPELKLARSIPTAVSVFSGSISGTTLSVTALAAGRPQAGDGLSGAGVTPGTTITAVLDVDAVTGLGTYSISQSQSVAAATLQALPVSDQLSSFSGAIDGTTLTVTALPQGSLNVGDVLAGQGVVPGTRITAVLSPFDPATGQGSYGVDRNQSLTSSALVAVPAAPSAPYTLEFWAQLQPGSNPNGAGLVALGQPSAGAIGPASLPEGWLLGASFVVDRITYQQAAAEGLIAAIPSGKQANDTYGWGWAVVATGADTTAMDGNGGNNLYSNALQINNLVSGVTLEGVNDFLNNYGVSAGELIGLNGSTAATLASLPFTELQFNTFLDSGNNNLPTSNLNGIAVDTNTAAMNGGLLQASDVENNANLNTLFTTLWNYQQQTGEAKVSFNLAPKSKGTTPTPTSNEQYSGYALEFTLLNGPAVSVNGQGELVFDVAPGLSLTSSTGVDLRDGQWHYIAATYLPEYEQTTIDGQPVALPTLKGAASLLVDSQVVASNNSVTAAFAARNLSDQALLLANNAGGGLDQFAIYDKALTNAVPPAGVAGVWPQISSDDALAAIAVLGYPLPGQSSSGTIPGAINEHWAARNVNPNDALLATYTSSFDPSSELWTPASLLNPQLASQPTTPSAVGPGSLQNDLVIAVPSSSWTSSGWNETGGNTSVDGFFNPANQQLQTVTVQLTGTSTPITLNSDQVLLGGQTLQSLQPLANGSSLNYTVLSDSPAFSLLIPADQIKNPADSYTATYTFQFADGTSVSNATPVPVNVFASSVASSGLSSSTVQTTLTNRSQALATAQVLEQAPLQLQYIDSGEVFRSRSTAATTSSKALSNTPESFGQSQVFGSFTDSSGTTNGWLAIAQPSSLNAGSDPAGRIWIQYTGQSSGSGTSIPTAQAPTTWLNALANSNFSPDAPNLPLLGDALYPSTSGGLLIQADPTAGWGQQLGQTMLVADVNNHKDGTLDLVIAAPAANGGGLVYIVDGSWIQNNLTQNTGSTILNLANPSALGPYVTILKPVSESIPTEGDGDGDYDTSVAGFGSALAFDGTNLWIGAPNVLQQQELQSDDKTTQTHPDRRVVPVGAIYSYSSSTDGLNSGTPTQLARTYTGTGGSAITLDPTGSASYTYWGSQLGSAIAISVDGQIAFSAPGVMASLEYSGTQQAQQQATGQKSSIDPGYGDGALLRIQLPSAANDNSISTTQGINNPNLISVTKQGTGVQEASALADAESAYMQNLKALQSVNIADATVYYNQALQALPVGAVYLFNSSSDLPSSGSTITAGGNGTATFYGAQPWNVLGPSGFGSSLTFADLINSNSDPVLAIGADQAGGSGAVYLVDTSQAFTDSSGWVSDINLGSNQYLGYLASGFTLYGAADADNFGNGLVNLGDVNNDGYDDLLIQAFNASEGAGNGYVLFGVDKFSSTSSISTTSGPLTINNPASGNAATATIGQMMRADGSTFTASLLNELGYGPSAFTGLGSFGPGDVNGDGLPDILLGAGGDASAYLTYGQSYLESISNLQLQKLTSNTGYRLEGLATTTQGSLRSVGDFNDDGYGDFISIQPGDFYTTVRLELGGNTEEILANYLYEYYSFTVANGTEVLGAGDINGDGYSDIALFLQQNLSSAADGNGGAGSTTGILFGRSSDQLPIGSGFGLQAPVDAASNPLAPLPSTAITGALSTMAPAMLAAGDTVYAVWVGEGSGSTDLWFAQSLDGGETWQPAGGSSNDGYAATKLSAYVPALASSITPSLALFNGRLYLAFLNDNDQISLSSWDPSSADPTLWSNPTVLSDGSAQLTSIDSPALIANGDVLSVIWVDGSSTLQASSSTTPDLSSISGGLGAASAWSPVGDGTSPNTPAIVSDGLTVYMAMRGENNQLYWTSSSDGGQSWYGWQELPSSMTTNSAPSLAIVEGELYLTFTGEDEQLFVTQLQAIGGNQWSVPPTKVSNQSAATDLGAVCIAETVDGVEGLALYYGDSNGSGDLLRTWSSTPLDSGSWSDSQRLGITTSSSNGFTTSSPLAVTRFQGNTVLAYLGDASSTNTTAYITTAGDSPNNSSSWTTISTFNTGNTLGISLASDAEGLLLNTSNSDTNDQSIYRLTPSTDGGSWSQSFYTNRSSISSSAPTAALLALPSTGSPAQLLLAVADRANSGSIDVSAFYPQEENSSWSPATPLQQLIDTDGTVTPQPIFATAAPSATLLDGTPVLAVNKDGVISVYASNGGNTMRLASSFSSETGGRPAGITSTDTGLALSYFYNADSVRLQRLNLLNPDGTPVEGVLINPDGSLDTSSGSLAWQGIELHAANGLSTGLATVPLNVNGGLLLGSTSNASGSTNQVLLSAIPVLSNPDSTTWLNSTVQLPDGHEGWTIQQQSGGSTGLHANQTGSSLSPVGDLNNDGYADLLVSANNVLLNPGSDPASATQATGLRVITGAATGSQIITANDATAASQTVQVAPGFGSSSTPVASLGASVNGVPTLVLSATNQSSGQGSALQSLPYNTAAAWDASAGNLASAQQLFSPTEAPVSGSLGLGLGFGDLALNTTGTYGDLNADGYLDTLVGDATFAFGVNGMGWHVWSIRAAGDVNGNGIDDVLLSLSPTEVPLLNAQSEPQYLQTVLVDGLLFDVDKATNSFSLAGLRRGLDPGVGGQQLNPQGQDLVIPALQYWIQGIQSFDGSEINDNNDSAGWSSLQTAPYQFEIGNGQEVYSIATATDDQGFGYLLYLTQTSTENELNIQYLDSANQKVVPLGTVEGTIFLPSATGIASTDFNSAAVYGGRLYLATLGSEVCLSSIDLETLRNGGIATADNWRKDVLSDFKAVSSPVLVNEGDQLSLYFVDSSFSVQTAFSTAPEAGANSWGIIKEGVFKQGNFAPIPTSSGNLTVNSTWKSLAATRYQGRTLLMRSTTMDGDLPTLWQQPSQAGADWTAIQSDVFIFSPTSDQYFWLNANATQVFATLWTNQDSEEDENNQSTTVVWGNEDLQEIYALDSAYIGTSALSDWIQPIAGVMAGSQLSLIVQNETSFDEFNTTQFPGTWTQVGSSSLAGYSVDGNIDVNGDGFMDMLVSDPSNPAAGLANQYVLFGGDYNQLASQVGTPGNDVMLGTPLADVIYSIQGADQVSSNGGADVIYTGAGDDAISIEDNAFVRIDAGSGFDVLLLEGLANQAYDFRLNLSSPEYFVGSKLRDIELISSIDYGANLLSFDAAAINAINPDRVLFLTPDASDSIALSAEFSRNASFDTSFAGTLWSAYASASSSATAASGNPALIYVRTPDGQSASWLDSQVSTQLSSALNATGPFASGRVADDAGLFSSNARGAGTGPGAAAAAVAADQPFSPLTSPIAASTGFGDGLTLVAYRTDPASGLARFSLQRADSRRRQVIAYASSSANSSAEPGREYTAVAGLVVLEAGQAREEITVPIDSAAFALLRGGSLSLLVEELADQGQQPLHLLIAPASVPDLAPASVTTAEAAAAGSAAPPVLSGFELVPSADGTGASLRFRADSNGGSQALDQLQLSVSRRASATSTAVEAVQTVSLLDAMVSNGDPPPAFDAVPGALALDNDQRHNGQISAQLALNFTAQAGQPVVSLVAPELQWQSSLQLQPDLSFSFSNAAPFTLWRADNGGSGPVSFGLQSGSQTITLLRDAEAGSAGSITPDSALSGDAITGWRATEGLSVGSRSAVDGLALTGTTWTPTASRDGQQLALLGLSQEGNQITASFAEGVTAVFGLQSTGSAPTPTPIRPAVEVQRLAGYDNSLGFYALDSVTGMVDGINPEESGYLQKALARSEASGLLLSAKELPGYGARQNYTDLPLDPNRSYGALLLVNGDRSRIYSSFAAANPEGAVHVINLGSSSTGLVLGFEDLPVTRGDMDYNDLVVNITGVSIPVF